MLYLKQSIFSYSLWQNGYRAKIQVGLHQLYLSLFTLCAVKGFVWFRVLMTRTRETEMQICLGKRTVRQRNRPRDRWVPANAFIHIFTQKKNVFTPVQRSRPTSAFTGRRHLLFHHLLYTTGLNAHLASAHVYIYTLIHTYSTYTVGSTANNLRGGRGTEWDARQCRLWQVEVSQNFEKWVRDPKMSCSFQIISFDPLNRCVCVDLNDEQSWYKEFSGKFWSCHELYFILWHTPVVPK